MQAATLPHDPPRPTRRRANAVCPQSGPDLAIVLPVERRRIDDRLDLRNNGIATLVRELSESTRVFIALTQRRRNGRARIVPPEPGTHFRSRSQDPRILKSLGRAWAWRRRLAGGQVATIHDLAKAEGFTDRFVNRIVRLAYFSPEVLERLVVRWEPPAISVAEMIGATHLPWARQSERVSK